MQNVIERGAILSNGSVLTLDAGFQLAARSITPVPHESRRPATSPNIEPKSMDEVAKQHILSVLAKTNGVIEGPAAERLVIWPIRKYFRRCKQWSSAGTLVSR
jgi:transcriptional regulator with GAF, ATPase, and Fis domain